MGAYEARNGDPNYLSMIFFSMFELDEYLLKISIINFIAVCFFPIPSGP